MGKRLLQNERYRRVNKRRVPMKKQSMNRGGFQKLIQNRKFRDNLSG